MFKRFMVGFVLGMLATQWYIHSSGSIMNDVNGWFRTAGDNYTGKKTHKAAEQVFDHSTSRR